MSIFKRHILFLLIAVLLGWSGFVESAESYKATKIPNYFGYGALHPENFSDGSPSRAHEFLDPNTIIYVASKRRETKTSGPMPCGADDYGSYAIDHRVYAYDLANERSSLLTTICFSDQPSYWGRGVVHMRPHVGKLFIALAGRLIVTDGSRAGTLQLGDFGSYWYRGTLGFNWHTITFADPNPGDYHLYFTVASDLADVYQGQFPESTRLWRSDGTIAGTNAVSQKHAFGHTIPFTANRHGYYFLRQVSSTQDQENLSLWRSKEDGISELVSNFGRYYIANFRPFESEIVSVRKGAFFAFLIYLS